ncbi:hypothetical protein [Paraburkholderia sp. C35]|uniref:hypothetical protein n=1 Tax=Paraburkholderia sp. C35 TaxID=2126993 RepID=UPI000D685A1F|nr:hypothetical protein [Paraburkholderia sp. C35]
MSAPDSNAKVPPSLLSEPAKDGQAGGSRILANLEGRVDPSANTRPKRSRTLPIVVAALVIAAGGVGAYQLQHRAAGANADRTAANGASTVMAASVKVASGVTANASAAPASSPANTPQANAPATIVADDDASKDASRTQASNDDSSRLSRALADGAGASDEGASAAIAANAKPASAAAVQHSDTASKAKRDKHDKRQLAEERHAKESKTAVASRAKKQGSKPEAKDDSDADLLAALVARTRPASANGTKAVDGQAASKKVSASGNANATLAERISECGEHGFFEEQICRWRVCDGHWGKDPHCPAASAQARQP